MTTTINRKIAAQINPIIDNVDIHTTLSNTIHAIAHMEQISLNESG